MRRYIWKVQGDSVRNYICDTIGRLIELWKTELRQEDFAGSAVEHGDCVWSLDSDRARNSIYASTLCSGFEKI
jgi:hypothetical protein